MNIKEALEFSDNRRTSGGNSTLAALEVLAAEVRRLQGACCPIPPAMKLFRFDPKGHGPYSFFVVAESEKGARVLVAGFIADKTNNLYPQDYDGFFVEGKYETAEIPPGIVTAHENY